MIPKNIERAHILKALQEIRRDGVPKHRRATKYALIFEDEVFPPKYVISIANRFANGEDLPATAFSGGAETNDFLLELGFDVFELKRLEISGQLKKQTKSKRRSRSQGRHSERCPECKTQIEEMLEAVFGEVRVDHRFNLRVLPEDYLNSEYSDALTEIHDALTEHRGFHGITRTDRLGAVDYYVPDPGFILEFDESQHFTAPRRVALEHYPDHLPLGFDRDRWIGLCEEIDQSDNDPPYRDEQRAWYDTLRDFLPTFMDLKPTVRLFAADREWCKLDPQDDHDLAVFKRLVLGRPVRKSVEIRRDAGPRFARTIICGEWDGGVEKARQVLGDICRAWPQSVRVAALVTPGGFLTFPWPTQMPKAGAPRDPREDAVIFLIRAAEEQCRQLLDDRIMSELGARANYVSIGVDSAKDRISLSQASIRQPHVELVALINLKTGEYHWTGKSFPTTGQQDRLIRITNIRTHVVDAAFGKVLILGCHDLTVFNPRSKAVTKAQWRKDIKAEFERMIVSEKPTTVLHHPHTTDTQLTWSASWNELARVAPSIDRYVGAGRYYNAEGERRSLDEVLLRTKRGPTLDFILKGYS